LLLYKGVRVSEIVGIKTADTDSLTSQLTVIGKGGKDGNGSLLEEQLGVLLLETRKML